MTTHFIPTRRFVPWRNLLVSQSTAQQADFSAQTPGVEMTTSRDSDTTIGAVVAGLCPVKKCCHSDTTGFVVEESACESINIAKSRFLAPDTGRRNDNTFSFFRHDKRSSSGGAMPRIEIVVIPTRRFVSWRNLLVNQSTSQKADLRPDTWRRNDNPKYVRRAEPCRYTGTGRRNDT